MATDVRAHITGTVWKIEVGTGETVRVGQSIVILESMKMELPIEAPVEGAVTRVLVAEGDSVQEGQVILTIA